MKYYVDQSNKPFVFDDTATAEDVAAVEAKLGMKLAPITKADYDALIAPTLDELKANKIHELQLAYEAANQADIAYMNTTFQADAKSQSLIVSVLSVGSVPKGFFWLDSNNVQIPMTYAELQGLSGALLARGQSNFVKFQGLKSQVAAAAASTEIDRIKW